MIEKGSNVTTVVVRCAKCQRPLNSPVSRVLRLGPGCRTGATEQQLAAVMAQGVLW